MPDVQSDKPIPDEESGRKNRKFAVSVNRGRARHSVRYVEIGGNTVDSEECTFCESIPVVSGADGDKSP
jgi:hypothetical protein